MNVFFSFTIILISLCIITYYYKREINELDNAQHRSIRKLTHKNFTYNMKKSHYKRVCSLSDERILYRIEKEHGSDVYITYMKKLIEIINSDNYQEREKMINDLESIVSLL